MHPNILFRKASSDEDQYEDSEFIECYEYDDNEYSSTPQSESQVEEESCSSQMINKKLLRQNLQNYGVMRGLHSYVDISNLKRLGSSSYIQFYDGRKYKKNKDINRHFVGVPQNEKEPTQGYETKTVFHNELFNLEDQRYVIDVEILQLKFLLKKTAKLNLNSYCAYKSFISQEQFSLNQQIEQQIEQLQKQKQNLKKMQEQETLIYDLSIDQKYFNFLNNKLEDFQTHKIIQFYQLKQNRIFTDASKAFQIQYLKLQPQWLNNMENNYSELQQNFLQLQPPLQIFSFQNPLSLQYSCYLIYLSIKKLCQTQHVHWMTMLFKDFFKSTFAFSDIDFHLIEKSFNENPNKTNFINYLKESLDYFLVYRKPNLDKMLDSSDQISAIFDSQYTQPFPQKKENLQFFPNFSQTIILYGETLLLELFHLHQEIFYKLINIFSLTQKIEYSNTAFQLSDVIIFLIISLIKEQIQDYEFYAFIKYTFDEESAIQIQSIFGILQKWKKGFLKMNENNKELLMIYTQRNLGTDACLKIQDAKLNLLTTPENILRRMKLESNQTKLCRFQNINNIIFAHHFILQDLEI